MAEFMGPRPAFCLELARRFTSRYPNNGPGWSVLSDSLTDFGRYGEARAALVQAFRLTPAHRRHFALAQAGRWRSAMGQHAVAARWYKRAVSASGSTDYHVWVGAALARAGRLAEAERWHRRALEECEGLADEAYYNLGLVLRATGRYIEALAAFDKALELDPAYERVHEAREDVVKAIAVRRELRLLGKLCAGAVEGSQRGGEGLWEGVLRRFGLADGPRGADFPLVRGYRAHFAPGGLSL